LRDRHRHVEDRLLGDGEELGDFELLVLADREAQRIGTVNARLRYFERIGLECDLHFWSRQVERLTIT